MNYRLTSLTGAALIALLGITLISCGPTESVGDQQNPKKAPQAKIPQNGVAVLAPTKGNNVEGTITLTQQDGQVHFKGEVRNLKPGKHGFHVHEYGDLRDPEGKSAGGHFNPEGHPHGGPNDPKRHAGDLGNIVANEKGVASVDLKAKGLMLHTVLGRAIVVHGGADDLKSQPSGDAGPRVALGIIGVAKDPAGK